MVWTMGVLGCVFFEGVGCEEVARKGSVIWAEEPVGLVEGMGERREGVGLGASVGRGVVVGGGAE